MRAKQVNKRLETLGGVLLRQRGSHRMYRVEVKGVVGFTTVPQGTKDIPIGTLRAIEKSLEHVLGKGWLR